MKKIFKKYFITLETIFQAFKNGSYEELYKEFLKLEFIKNIPVKIQTYNLNYNTKFEYSYYLFTEEEAVIILYNISKNTNYKLKYHPYFRKLKNIPEKFNFQFGLDNFFNIGDLIYDIHGEDRKGFGIGKILHIYSGNDLMRVKFSNVKLPVMVLDTLFCYDRSADYLKTIIEELNGQIYDEKKYNTTRCYLNYEINKLLKKYEVNNINQLCE